MGTELSKFNYAYTIVLYIYCDYDFYDIRYLGIVIISYVSEMFVVILVSSRPGCNLFLLLSCLCDLRFFMFVPVVLFNRWRMKRPFLRIAQVIYALYWLYYTTTTCSNMSLESTPTPKHRPFCVTAAHI